MPRKPKALPLAKETELDPFERQFERALEHFTDPVWLGDHSPLAAPYFLGQTANTTSLSASARERGELFQRTVSQLAGQLEHELAQVLHVAYLARKANVDNVGLALSLNMGERTFYRVRQKAVKAIAFALYQAVSSPLRAETPILRELVGRSVPYHQALTVLDRGEAVYIVGPSGVGKTTLGAAIAAHWPARRVFWYTLRRDFNDQTSSLIFALGHLLRSLGAGNTWRQLVADRGVVDFDRVLSLLRYELELLRPEALLICIDEMDVLQDDRLEHVQILHLLEELRACGPLLLIGQRALIQADLALQLEGLETDALDILIRRCGISALDEASYQRLLLYTRGYPVLVQLVASLIQSGVDIETALATLPKTPSIEALFQRIWRRLGDAERALLMQLAVFRSAAPADAWRDHAAELATLQQRGLLLLDNQGGVQLLPHTKSAAYDHISADLRPHLHQMAADLRAARAEYVSAMHHALAAQQPALAVWLWFAHREQEIERGRGAAALEILRRIALTDLAEARDRTALQIARSELLQLAGDAEGAELELRNMVLPARSTLRAYVDYREGHLAEMQGRVEQSLQHYRAALETLVGLPQHNEVLVHSQMSFLHLYRLHDLTTAEQQALLARAKAEAFLGDIAAMRGHYRTALAHLLAAQRDIEEHGQDLAALSRVYSYLGALYGRLGEAALSLHFSAQAIECDRRRGDTVSPLYDVLNRATVLSVAGRPAEALTEAQQALAVAERLRHPYLISGLAAGVAEAQLGLAQWAEAEHFAQYSLSQEEEFFRAAALVVMAQVRHHQHRDGEAIALLQAAQENARDISDRFTEAAVCRVLGQVYLDTGARAAAHAALTAALTIYADLELEREIAAVQQLLTD